MKIVLILTKLWPFKLVILGSFYIKGMEFV